jgi:hypothetical protein
MTSARPVLGVATVLSTADPFLTLSFHNRIDALSREVGVGLTERREHGHKRGDADALEEIEGGPRSGDHNGATTVLAEVPYASDEDAETGGIDGAHI